LKRFKKIFTIRYILPLSLLLLVGYLLLVSLSNDPSKLPSALKNKPLPTLTLKEIFSDRPESIAQTIQGQVTIINIWSTWCPSCKTEYPLIKKLAKEPHINLTSIVYKDSRSRALTWLSKNGNPYQHVWLDEDGSAGIELGIYGTPELFIVDKQGIVRYRYAGAIRTTTIENNILPLVGQLLNEQ